MLTTILIIVVSVLVGLVAGLKIIAPLTQTTTDDKILELLDKVPLAAILEYVKNRR